MFNTEQCIRMLPSSAYRRHSVEVFGASVRSRSGGGLARVLVPTAALLARVVEAVEVAVLGRDHARLRTQLTSVLVSIKNAID